MKNKDEGEDDSLLNSEYYRYEIVGDATHKTDIFCTTKTVLVRKVPVRGVTLTVGLFFDGTGNNQATTLDRTLAYGDCSNVVNDERAKACEKYETLTKNIISNTSYRGGITNISRLFQLYKIDGELNDKQLTAQVGAYVSGVGTEDGKGDSLIGMALGSSLLESFQGVVTKTDRALDIISIQLNRFINSNKGQVAIAKVQFDLFGFSRGAASARHFANRVMHQDSAITDAINKGLISAINHGKPAGEVRFIGLFDTVAAVGSLLNFYDLNSRSNPGVNLELRPSVAKHVFQISAMHECRHNFSANSICGAWPELLLPGVHSNIGGGYNAANSERPENEDNLLTMPRIERVRESTPERQTQTYLKTEAMRKLLTRLPALKYILPHGQVRTRVFSWPQENQNKSRANIFEKNVGAAVFLKRQRIPNDWEKVSMRVMLDAAQDAGVIFEEIDPVNPDTILPIELIHLCEKAIAQGRAVRRGQDVVGYTESEMHIIGRYIHCSANWNIVSDPSLWVDPDSNEIFLKQNRGAAYEKAFAWPNAPCNGWVRTVWKMDDPQWLEERQRINADALDELF